MCADPGLSSPPALTSAAKQDGPPLPCQGPARVLRLQPPSLHLEGFSVADPDGLRTSARVAYCLLALKA